METETTDNLNRDELFETLKDKCKTKVKRSIPFGIMFLILAVCLILFWSHIKGISWYWVAIGCWAVWFVLSNYWYQKKIEATDTPDQLLCEFDKNNRTNRIGTIVLWFVLIGIALIIAIVNADLSSWMSVFVIVGAGLVTYLMYNSESSQMRKAKERDEAFREQLQDLIEKK